MHASCKTALIAGLAAFLLGGCAQKSYVALLESPDGTTGQVIVKSNKGEQVIATARQGAPLDGSSAPAPVDDAKLKKDFGDAMAARPLPADHYQLYFESGGAVLTADSGAMLPKIVEAASKRPAVDISVIGHTDTVGKADLNEALALKRANTVAELLKAKGLKVHALTVESHGERNLLVKTPDETAEPRNRRVEISIR